MREGVWLALVHHPTVDRDGAVVATAITSLDLHDLARLARTYGLAGVYATTPLTTQHALATRLLAHWVQGRGGEVNPCRREALRGVRLADSLDAAVQEQERHWGRAVQVVGTSARTGAGRVPFGEARNRLAAGDGPVLLVFGTGWGLAPEALAACHWLLEPVQGCGPYNHLSVRSAASIVVDRLFGDR